MDRRRVAVTLEQCWHDVPGGTATSALRTVDALARGGRVDPVGVSARHRGPPAEAFRPSVPVRSLALPRLLLYESWHRLRRPSLRRVVPEAAVGYVTGVAMPPADLPLVVTVHDLAVEHHPQHHTRQGRRFLRRALELTRDDATLVLCPSEATRADCERYGIDGGRLRVVPWGVDAVPVVPAQIERVRRRHDLDGPFVLWVGTIEPRKNLGALVDAVERMGRADLTLVVVGPEGWNEDLGALLADRPLNVRALGFVPESELHALYAAAAVFCYPSLLEGFGLPVLEAAAQGTPVVTSAGTATEEALGPGGTAVDPSDVDAIAEAIAVYLDDEDLAAAVGAAGREHAAAFTWEATADAVADALLEAAA
jgi:glycosyltransferase involved in cell wall biosynthesis